MSTDRPLAISGRVRPRLVMLVALATAGIVLSVLTGVAQAAEPLASPTPGLAMAEARVGHSSTLLADGSVLIAGGIGATDVIDSAELFDPNEGRFEPTGSLGQARILHTATRLPDGRVLVTGGMRRIGRTQASIELYDPQDGEFSAAGRLRKARAGHTATLLNDGRVLIVGGTGKVGGRPLASVELYDPATGRAKRAGRLKTGRAYHTATLLDDGTVLVVGGSAFDEDGGAKVFKSAELYDPVSGRFTAVGALKQARWSHIATRLDDGTVLIVGGSGDDQEPLSSAELYDPVSRRFTAVADLKQAAALPTATRLDDGRVLVIGENGMDLPSAQIFDPATRAFTDIGSLHSARNGFRATRLEDGTVLVSGGRGSMWPVDSAELFDPVTMRVVAFGPIDPAANEPLAEPPLPPLGRSIQGGRVEMTGSGFAMTFPDDWTIEIADPDPDVFTAAPGEAWEALRAHDPKLERACSVSVGVAKRSLRKRSGGASDVMTTEPRWDERGRAILWVPLPRVGPDDSADFSMMAPRERYSKRGSRLEHDVMYVVSCSAVGGGEIDGIDLELERLAETFRYLPSED